MMSKIDSKSTANTDYCRHLSLIFSLIVVLGLMNGCTEPQEDTEATVSSPNIVVLFLDDVGYGDLSSYGHPVIKTPNIDELGSQGVRFTSFVTAMWCVPSRTQLLTGRYMPRVNFNGGTGAGGKGGLPDSELTLAEGLKEAGYNTGMAGKWHLGYKQKKFLPTGQGFDSWFGMPYSNDYRKPWVNTDEPLGLYRGDEMVEHPVNQDSLTVRYTAEALNFIDQNGQGEQPFFFYLAYNMAHLPIHTTDEFRGKSRGGLYGDVIETLDWSVGQVLDKLDEMGISDNTIVFFASDNGPWLNLPDRMRQEGNLPWHQGSSGLLRGYKHTSYEGGNRVPAMIRWPGQIPPGQVTDQLVAAPDIYRTLLETGGGTLPEHTLDGQNVMNFLKGEEETSPRKEYAYFRNGNLEAMRMGDWKLRVIEGYPQLFNLQVDPSEEYNRADEKPGIVNNIKNRMQELADEVDANLGPDPETEKEQ
ncbi:sulfatase family protein [Fodinibius salsisoli]|uniref:Sulfatase n=1 Tax=Fodinibius salsisoli TaxID=2820877 RepID=A0ABT3PQD6_9BACT|nr:sulfatase [Fodinibius salsisoli]MCW9708077.1 sulfatase [Fodinibius salsisoli]